MKKVVITILMNLFFVILIGSVSADGTINGRPGNVDVPGQQVSVIDFPDKPEDEEIPEPESAIENGVMTVALNFEDASKFAIRTAEVCSAIDNIIIETNQSVTGSIKLSRASEDDFQNIDNVINTCKLELEGFDNSLIENVTWNLKVSRDELEQKDIPINKVKLFVKENDDFDRIRTSRSEDSNSEAVIYEANTENFSDGVFIVAEGTNNIFTTENIAYAVFSTIGFLILVAIGYLLLRKE